jgi:hypothetical protein
MSETRSYLVYEFNELNKESKEISIKELHNINVDVLDWEKEVIEEYKEKLNKDGYENINIYYSGFWFQGNGASFTSNVNVKKWLVNQNKWENLSVETKNSIKEESYCTIRKHGHYENSKTIFVEDMLFIKNYDIIIKEINIENEIINLARKMANELYKSLEELYEYYTSKEVIIETINLNNIMFRKNGKPDI